MQNNHELEIVIQIAKEAGLILLKYYNLELNVLTKENGTPVSDADKAADEFILKKLRDNFDYPILSEESIDNIDRLKSDRVWIVDPLDGTVDFINKADDFVVAIGLIERGIPILGVVYKPITKELFFATRGGGAFSEINHILKRLNVSECDSISETRLVAGNLDSKHSEVFDRVGIKNKTRVGSASLQMCKIAQGEYDVTFRIKTKMSEWDDCAAGLILEEAGGVLTDIFGNRLQYNQENVSRAHGILASNKNIHKKLLEKLILIANEYYK